MLIEEEIEDRQGCYMIFPLTPGRGNFKGYNFNGLSFAGYLTARGRLRAGGRRMRTIHKTGTGSTLQKGGNAKKLWNACFAQNPLSERIVISPSSTSDHFAPKIHCQESLLPIKPFIRKKIPHKPIAGCLFTTSCCCWLDLL